MDVSMQSQGRIEKYKDMDTEALKNMIGMRIENPQIFKEFMASETIDWDYAVAAGILTRADVKYIKEELNSEESEGGKEPGSALEPKSPSEVPAEVPAGN